MCGISGFLDLRAETSEAALGAEALAMAATLAHRGPDDGGTWVDASCGIALAHRRLAILDLSPQGHQPMLSADGRLVIVFNGEIYNFVELRAELERAGHVFRGGSDTEVMLAALGEWGVPRAVERMNGMFAFALWDRGERRLYLVRDRLGIKPLYYGVCGQRMFFASELRALRAHPGFVPDIDRHALAAFIRHGYVPAPHAIYRGVRKLPPGTILSAEAESARTAVPQAYWSARDVSLRGLAGPYAGSDDEALEELDRRLRRSVTLQMIADVPLGAFLSGGVDSSLVASLMQAQSTRPVRTFTIGFREAEYDEAAHARAVARHLGTDHTEVYLDHKYALDLIPEIPDWYDEPFADSSQLPTYLVSRMTRAHVTVALSGDGGDELFAGYPRYFWTRNLYRGFAVPLSIRRAIAATFEFLSPAAVDSLAALLPRRRGLTKAHDSVRSLAAALRVNEVGDLYRHLVSQWQEPDRVVLGATEPRGILWDASLTRDLPDLLPRLQLVDLVTYLPDDVLAKVDRASMAVSLEARVPLLDHDVVEFAWRLPMTMKVRGRQRKWLLRRLLHRYVPQQLVDRPKMGFAVPIDAWLRGPLRDWAEALLDESRLRREGFLDPATIRGKWQEHLCRSRNWQYALWNVLMFQAWRERWT